jgi:sulfite reductase (ferredoxin)
MAIDVRELSTRPLDPEIAEELDKFEEGVRQYVAGELEEDVFRVFRLNQGIYGQRQGGHNQMVRVKVPHGSLQPEQL